MMQGEGCERHVPLVARFSLHFECTIRNMKPTGGFASIEPLNMLSKDPSRSHRHRDEWAAIPGEPSSAQHDDGEARSP